MVCAHVRRHAAGGADVPGCGDGGFRFGPTHLHERPPAPVVVGNVPRYLHYDIL